MAKRKREAKAADGIWQPLSRPYGAYGYVDHFGGIREPSKWELLKEFSDIVYSCVNLLASTVASVPLRLYVQTRAGEPRPKGNCKAISDKTWERATKSQFPTVRKAVEIHEVQEHPILDLLYRANDRHNFHDLVELTDIYQELVGSAYWYVARDALGFPQEIYILPSQFVTPVLATDGYTIEKYLVRHGTRQIEYPPEDIIQFSFHNPMFPYGEGYSPLRAAWERVKLSKLELAFQVNNLANQARPDAVLSPKDALGNAEAERLAKDFSQRFRQNGVGGIMVMPEPMDLETLSWQPNDVVSPEHYRFTRITICNAFQVPPGWFDASQSNRSIAESEQYKLALNAILPRVRRRDEKLNEQLLPMFGEDRFFLMSDDPVPENEDRELTKRQAMVSMGALSRDEWRLMEGLESQAWAKEPLVPAGMFPVQSVAMQGDRAAQIKDIQLAVYSGSIPREAGLGTLVVVHQMTRQEAESLLPETENDGRNDAGTSRPNAEASENDPAKFGGAV